MDVTSRQSWLIPPNSRPIRRPSLFLRAPSLPLRPHKRPRSTPVCAQAHPQKLLILGGTGRVGAETAKSLLRVSPFLALTLAGRSPSRAARVIAELSSLADTPPSFVRLDITDDASLSAIVPAFDAVLHAAGPFQRVARPDRVLRAALDARLPYVDISDDATHSAACKRCHDYAVAKNTPAIISAGIYPGLANLLAARVAAALGELSSLRIYYHTAGSGGIGPTVLASTFLLLSEPAEIYSGSGLVTRPAAGDPEVFDFGGRIGKITTYLLNLPEVSSLHKHLAPREVFAKFSTAPPIWNVLLQGMARLPADVLGNRSLMRRLATVSMPIVRAVDALSGARTGIAVVARGGGACAEARYEHERLSTCVGDATAAFVRAVLEGDVGAGVWFPEEVAIGVRDRIIREGTESSDRFDVLVDREVAS